jgi:hypothetical protein
MADAWRRERRVAITGTSHPRLWAATTRRPAGGRGGAAYDQVKRPVLGRRRHSSSLGARTRRAGACSSGARPFGAWTSRSRTRWRTAGRKYISPGRAPRPIAAPDRTARPARTATAPGHVDQRAPRGPGWRPTPGRSPARGRVPFKASPRLIAMWTRCTWTLVRPRAARAPSGALRPPPSAQRSRRSPRRSRRPSQ